MVGWQKTVAIGYNIFFVRKDCIFSSRHILLSTNIFIHYTILFDLLLFSPLLCCFNRCDNSQLKPEAGVDDIVMSLVCAMPSLSLKVFPD